MSLRMRRAGIANWMAAGLFAAAVCLSVTSAAPRTWFGGTGSWHQAAHWIEGSVPLAGDAVTVHAGVIHLAQATPVLASVTLYGGRGGGGRIAVWYGDVWDDPIQARRILISASAPASFEGAASVLGGAGGTYASGEDGTFRFVWVLHPAGVLLCVR